MSRNELKVSCNSKSGVEANTFTSVDDVMGVSRSKLLGRACPGSISLSGFRHMPCYVEGTLPKSPTRRQQAANCRGSKRAQPEKVPEFPSTESILDTGRAGGLRLGAVDPRRLLCLWHRCRQGPVFPSPEPARPVSGLGSAGAAARGFALEGPVVTLCATRTLFRPVYKAGVSLHFVH